MPYSYETYICPGDQGEFVFDFNYLSQEHIAVFLDGDELEEFDFITPRTIGVDPDPPLGSILQIRRLTPRTAREVTFTSASIRDPATFNRDADQLLYLIQEALDESIDALKVGNDDQWDGQGRIGRNFGLATGGSDLPTLAQVQALISGNVVINLGPQRFTFVATEGQTEFSIDPYEGIIAENCFVTVNTGTGAVVAEAADYAMNGAGSAVVFTVGLTAGDTVEIRVLTGQVVGEIQPGAIGTDHLEDGAVTTDKLADAAATGLKIAADSINASHIAEAAVGTSELADNAVGTAEIVDGAVTTAKLTTPFPSTTARKTVGSGTSYWYDKPGIQNGGKPRLVQIITRNTSGGEGKEFQFEISVDDAVYVPMAGNKLDAGGLHEDTLTGWVPPGYWYRLVKTSGNDSGASVREWWEIDIGQ